MNRGIKMSRRDDIFKNFIKYEEETKERSEHGIEQNRKGFAKITIKDKSGNPIIGQIIKVKQKKHEFLYWEFPEAGGQKALRMGDWKAFVKNIRNGSRKVELYNLSKDPREQNDVAEQHPDLVKKVLEIFRSEHTTPEIKKFEIPIW